MSSLLSPWSYRSDFQDIYLIKKKNFLPLIWQSLVAFLVLGVLSLLCSYLTLFWANSAYDVFALHVLVLKKLNKSKDYHSKFWIRVFGSLKLYFLRIVSIFIKDQVPPSVLVINLLHYYSACESICKSVNTFLKVSWFIRRYQDMVRCLSIHIAFFFSIWFQVSLLHIWIFFYALTFWVGIVEAKWVLEQCL